MPAAWGQHTEVAAWRAGRSEEPPRDRETSGPRRRLAQGLLLIRRGESDPAVRLD